MAWINNDGLRLRYGTEKATPTKAGDYLSYGEDRTIELFIDISTLTTTAAIQDYATVIPAGVFVDSVILEATTAAATITSLSIGAVKLDYSTNIADNAFADAVVVADLNGAGETKVLTGPPASGGAGTKVGTTFGSDAGYITAKIAGSAGTGVIKVLIKYRGVPPITQ